MAPKKLASVLAARGDVACGVAELGNIFSAAAVAKGFSGAGVQPIHAAELMLVGEVPKSDGQPDMLGTLVLVVQDGEGWKNLSRLVSEANFSKGRGGAEAVTLAQLRAHAAGLLCFSGGVVRGCGYGSYASGSPLQVLEELSGIFEDRLYIQLERYDWPTDEMRMRQKEGEARLLAWAKAHAVPPVATHDVRFFAPEDREACEALLCIHDGTVLDDPKRRRLANDMHLKTADEMAAAFADLPAALENTVEIAKRTAFYLAGVDVKAMYMPEYTRPDSGMTGPPDNGEEASPPLDVNAELREQSAAGLVEKLRDFVYPLCDGEEAKAVAKAKYEAQLEFELDVIISMGFPGYFLITSDFIKWAKAQDIPVGPGRGSGAGSLVAWCLQITDLDPIRWGLYFERFLNPDRVSLPDFDIDFCQDRREEVIAYVRRRFGEDRVSQIITFGTLKARACLRDVGRVLGMGYSEVGKIAAFVPEGPTPPPIADVLKDDERLRELYESDDNVKRLVDTAMKLEGCTRHASTHAAGVIITDRPIAEVCGLYVDVRSPMPATQLSMNDAEYAGLVKFDFLGLKTLSVVKMGCDLVAKGGRDGIDILKISLEDQATFDEVKKGHTLGIFQIESAGMTELTKRMKADDLEALSALVALYRPGPLGTGMVDDYIACRLGQKEAVYPHPVLQEALEPTFGVPVYQEQIMRMARDLAGYTLGGADMLRRAMGKKKPEEMAKERVKFVRGAAEKNDVSEEQANAIFDLMETFAGYGFNKAHSLAYALISYQTAWLKAHHPMEFMSATMTYDRGNMDKLFRYKVELERMGATLHGADVNASEVFFSVEPGAEPGVRHALAALKGAGEEAMRRIVAERKASGAFKTLWDFCARMGSGVLNKKQMEVLAKGGALDTLAKATKLTRAEVVQNVDVFCAYAAACTEQKESGQTSFFGTDSGDVDPAPYVHTLKRGDPVDAMDVLAWEQEVVGFYLSDHPLSGFVDELRQLANFKPLNTIEDFAAKGGGAARVAGVVLSVREVKTKSGGRMGIINLTDPSGQGEVVIFPDAYGALYELLHSGEPLFFNVRVQQDGERLRVSSEEARPLKDVIAAKDDVEILVPEAALLPRVQSLLAGAGAGRTRVQLRLKTPLGEALVKLPGGVSYSPTLVAGLRQALGGV